MCQRARAREHYERLLLGMEPLIEEHGGDPAAVARAMASLIAPLLVQIEDLGDRVGRLENAHR